MGVPVQSSDARTGDDVPNLHRLVITRAEEPLLTIAVAEADATHTASVSFKRPYAFPGLHLPHLHRFIT